jgi:inner membrane protein
MTYQPLEERMSPTTLNAAKLPSRSIGVKLIVVCFLAVVMTIPAFFVWSLIDDRSHRADEVVNEVSALVGGPQTFVGPIIAVPYTLPPVLPKAAEHSVYIVFPAHAEAIVETHTEERHRSLFKVPVYHSDIVFNASFDLAGVPANAPDGAVLDWSRAEFLVGATDARGAQSDIVLDAGGKNYTLGPAVVLPAASVNSQPEGEKQVTFFGTPAAGLARPDAKFDVTAKLKFSGAQRLSFLASAKTTMLTMKGDWPHPSFNGTFLPATQNITPSGFEAGWSVPFIARGVPGEGTVEILTRLGPTVMGVSFIELADPYQSVTRSLKYAVLFIGLVFLSYFLFEVTAGKRLHPAQFILIGIAQIIFYLLLLSIAERIGFDFAFLLSAVATVGLISSYAGWVFASRTYALRALAVFSLLYGLIYLLLRLEDQALLIGAIVSFAAISTVMYVTRHLDWYGSAASPVAEVGPAVGGA